MVSGGLISVTERAWNIWTCNCVNERGNCCCFIFVNLCIASKLTEISNISVVMCVSDHFVDGKLQFT